MDQLSFPKEGQNGFQFGDRGLLPFMDKIGAWDQGLYKIFKIFSISIRENKKIIDFKKFQD